MRDPMPPKSLDKTSLHHHKDSHHQNGLARLFQEVPIARNDIDSLKLHQSKFSFTDSIVPQNMLCRDYILLINNKHCTIQYFPLLSSKSNTSHRITSRHVTSHHDLRSNKLQHFIGINSHGQFVLFHANPFHQVVFGKVRQLGSRHGGLL